MSSALEAALRAAMDRGGAAKQPTTPSTNRELPTSTVKIIAKRKQKQRRKRQRSRSDSMASDLSTIADPVQRMEKFKAKMFDVGKGTTLIASAVLSGKPADEIVKVHWKAKTKTTMLTSYDSDDVPQLTRPRVVVASSVAKAETAVSVALLDKKKKKEKTKLKNQQGRKVAPQQIEVVVPQVPSKTTQQTPRADALATKRQPPATRLTRSTTASATQAQTKAKTGPKRQQVAAKKSKHKPAPAIEEATIITPAPVGTEPDSGVDDAEEDDPADVETTAEDESSSEDMVDSTAAPRAQVVNAFADMEESPLPMVDSSSDSSPELPSMKLPAKLPLMTLPVKDPAKHQQAEVLVKHEPEEVPSKKQPVEVRPKQQQPAAEMPLNKQPNEQSSKTQLSKVPAAMPSPKAATKKRSPGEVIAEQPAEKRLQTKPTTAPKKIAKDQVVEPRAVPANPEPSTAETTSVVAEQEDLWDINSVVKHAMNRGHTDSVSDAESVNAPDYSGKVFKDHRLHLFSELIDEAAREEWELVEVGRLVRIFSGQWGRNVNKTARFLRRYCPELVSVDFLEGLNMSFSAKQLIKIFDRGSGSAAVLMNKIASAVENGNLSVHDHVVQEHIAAKTQRMATNHEIVAFLLPLLESLSKVKDVSVLLKAICLHWHADRTAALVQDILLTPVFDDLDGRADEIVEDLPELEGRLDFPSCMDDEDADENGNLEGLIAGEDSDLGESDAHSEDEAEENLGEILSDDAEGEDSHAEDEVYEGDTDSEEEEMMRELLNPTKPRRRSRFILDEADEDDGEEEEHGDDDLIEDDLGDDGDSSGDSSEEEEDLSPRRKRLRRG